MVAFLGVTTFFTFIAASLIVIVQIIRRRPCKKWLAVCGASLLCFLLCIAMDWDTEPAEPSVGEREPRQTIEKESDAEPQPDIQKPKEEAGKSVKEFAEDHGISVKLAQNIEDVLMETEMPDSLESLKDWERIEDYADGQRYTAWCYSVSNERYYYMMFYVKDDTVESIRDRDNALAYLYSRPFDEK